MPKITEYRDNGVREVYIKKRCHSCWDCQYCINMVDPTQYMCKSKWLSSSRNRNFPYDNTKCEEFRLRNED